MKINIEREPFLKALSMARKVTGTNRLGGMLQGHVMMRADTDALAVCASNGTNDITIDMPCEVTTDGDGCVPIDPLMNAMDFSRSPNIDIVFDGSAAKVRNSQYSLPLTPVSEYAKIERLPDELIPTIAAPAKVLRSGIKSVGWAQYQREDKEFLRAVYITPHEGKLRLCATSGNTLAVRNADLECKSESTMLLPSDFVALIEAIMPDDDNQVVIAFSDRRSEIKFDASFGHVVIGSVLINGKFPYEQFTVLTTKLMAHTQKAELNPEEFHRIVAGVSKFTDDLNPGVLLDFQSNQVRISAKSKIGSADEVVVVKCETPFKCRVHPSLILPALNSLNCESATIGHIDAVSPIAIYSDSILLGVATMRVE